MTGALLVLAAVVFRGLDFGFLTSHLPYALCRVIFGYTIGALLFRLWRSGRLPLSLSPWIPIPLLLLALVGLPQGNRMTLVYDLLIVCGLFPVLVYLGASAGLSQRLAPLANALGNLSYAIYVLHVPLLAFFMAISSRLLHKTSAEAPPRPGWLFILFVMAAAFLIDRIYDRPARGWLAARLLPRKR